MIERVLKLPPNEVGRDFVIGDIHFKTIELYSGLKALDFDSAIDRVIAVGDLIDRGQGVLDGLKLLGEPWFFTVQGNHEQMLINAYRTNPDAPYSAHGAGWWSTIADESKAMIISKLESLPLIIEIECPRGIVGVVHADVPAGMCWGEFVEDIANPRVEQSALWGRSRVTQHYRAGVEGVWRVCVGHTWTPSPIRLGNVLALDCTGGREGALGIYCVQDDTIYIDAKPVSIDKPEILSGQLQELESILSQLKTQLASNRLIESQALSRRAEALVKHVNSGWLALQNEARESERFTNALHGLSLSTKDKKASKLEGLKDAYAGTWLAGVLKRLSK
jgi:serine/threonine protein phosphatase 1